MKLLFLLILALPFTIPAESQNKVETRYYIDRLHSSANFAVEYIEIMEFNGRADDYFAIMHTDENRKSISNLEFIIKAKSLNTAMNNRDRDLHSSRYLNVENYPEITYKSDSFYTRNDTLISHGNLTIKGISKKVEVPYKMNISTKNSSRTLIVIKTIPIKIKRSEFEIGTIQRSGMDKIFLGDEIEITINALFRQIRPREIELHNRYPATIIENLDLKKFIGTFQSESGVEYNIEIYDNRLFFVLPEAGVLRTLHPISKNSFIVSDVGYLLEFNSENEKVKSLFYKRGGEDNSEKWQHMKKIK